MELKKYQQDAINNLRSYLAILSDTMDIEDAFRKFWLSKGVNVGLGAIASYQDILPGIPNLCFKVPTGGGKTFMGCAAIKPVFDALPPIKTKAVVWLVPSDAILEQTLKNLKDSSHPYRQRLNADFGGRVEVYSKEELLNGQNFTPSVVVEQLTVMVLSFDSFRGRSRDALKAFKENSSLSLFSNYFGEPEFPVENADTTALFQVINQLNPLIVVDESHHARSKLSVETLKDFNPCFVLDLTATPRKESNIISITDASALKRANMVKLPVILYNRASKFDVLADAIVLRNSLEAQACLAEEDGGQYIRPIVLFQAQPRGKEDSTTFEKLRDQLVEVGIPRDQIAVKTAEINELKKVDLLSRDCPIRYIITVNALKEGWDCPFAYILATLANRTSTVDVEQILGRVLRQPYARRSEKNNLNISYVLTSSADFQQTIKNVIKGLNEAGFSGDDYRVGSEAYEGVESPSTDSVTADSKPEQTNLDLCKPAQNENEETEDPDFLFGSESLNYVSSSINASSSGNISEVDAAAPLLEIASSEAAQYDEIIKRSNEEDGQELPSEVRDAMKTFKIKEIFRNETKDLMIPQFFIEDTLSMFADEKWTLLDPPELNRGFTLNGKPYDIDFAHVESEAVRIDVDEHGSKTPKAMLLSREEDNYMRGIMESKPGDERKELCIDLMLQKLNKSDELDQRELKKYLRQIVDGMKSDELADLEKMPIQYASKISVYIKSMLEEHRYGTFKDKLNVEKIICKPSYSLPLSIHTDDPSDIYAKTLYEAEGKMNGFEDKVALHISSFDNVAWWHRNPERGFGFRINGFINHYPDFIIKLNSGKIIIAETKGEPYKNDDSRLKIELGKAWADAAGRDYRYFMIFDDDVEPLEGAYTLSKFKDLISQL